MTEDQFDRWAAESKTRRDERDAREHRTIAELLVRRGHTFAAGLLAASTYVTDCVDSWNGGQYEVAIGVPPALFDQLDIEVRTALESAAKDVIGEDHFRALVVQVRLSEAEPGWQQKLFESLRPRAATIPEPIALESGGDHLGEG